MAKAEPPAQAAAASVAAPAAPTAAPAIVPVAAIPELSAVEVSETVPAPASAAAVAAALTAETALPPSFTPATDWAGAREGYVFKQGAEGLGYYLDEPPVPGAAPIGRLFVTADSIPLFGKWMVEEVGPGVAAALAERPHATTAAYIGACNEDLPDYFSMFEHAVGSLSSLKLRPVHVICTKQSPDQCAATLQSASLIVIAGGDVQLGWRAMEASGLPAALRAAAAVGTVIIGISAGAIVMGTHGYSGAEDKFAPPFPTLGLVPYCFGAYDEGAGWGDVRRALTMLSASPDAGAALPVVGIGIQTNGAATLHDGGQRLEPSLKDIVVMAMGRAPPPPSGEERGGSTSADAVPVVFIDVEGVLVCNDRGLFEQEKLERLASIADQCPGTEFVLTSEMRKAHKEKKSALSGIGHPMFGLEMATPDATPVYGAGRTFAEDNWQNRPFEISQWFRTTSMVVGNWVVIDSHSLVRSAEGGSSLNGHFVKTDEVAGLTVELADRVVEMLNRAKVMPMGMPYTVEQMRAAVVLP